jgi:Zn-dependent M28 family amino/carboxypeptidase
LVGVINCDLEVAYDAQIEDADAADLNYVVYDIADDVDREESIGYDRNVDDNKLNIYTVFD